MSTHPLWRAFELPTDEEIARARVGKRTPAPVEIVAYDPAWPQRFEALAAKVRGALGERALAVHHVGSTSVPGLAAKPMIDIDLLVADSADEVAYVPALEAVGYRLRVREPDWEEHRVLRLEDPATNLHVLSPSAIEWRRHLAFRDWLRAHPAELAAYAQCKRAVAAQGFTDVMQYNNAKAGFVYDLYERIFAADAEHSHDPRPRT